MEGKLNLGFGFPAVVAVSPSKKMMGTMRGSFTNANLNSFLSDLLIGKGGLSPLPTEMKFKKVDKWDGKDAEIIEEEPLDYGDDSDSDSNKDEL